MIDAPLFLGTYGFCNQHNHINRPVGRLVKIINHIGHIQNLDILPNITDTVKKSKDPIAVKKRIIIAATKNFAKNGYAKTSLNSIAETSKVSKGGIYHHFPSKEELFIAVLFQHITISEDVHSKLFQNKNNLIKDLNESYSKIVEGPLDFAKIFIEGISESLHNTKLRKLLNQGKEEAVKISVARLKEVRKNIGIYEGFTDEELIEIAELIIYLYRGMMIERVMGKDPKIIRKRWIKAIQMVFALKK